MRQTPFQVVVTGTKDGKSASEYAKPWPVIEFEPTASKLEDTLWASDVWVTDHTPPRSEANYVPPAQWRVEPPSGCAVFRMVNFPAHTAGSGLHKTNTLDFCVVVSGDIWLALEGEEVHLRAGDCVVQRATVHAWENRSDDPCLMCAILMSTLPV
jgi:quercetin dioxygenase-like cupin family protein